MDPEVQKALLKLVEEAKGLAAQEIPLVLKDLLTAGIVENIIGILVSFVGVLGIILLLRAYRYWQIQDERKGYMADYELQRFFGGAAILGIGCVSTAILGISVYNLFIIWLAPRAYLLGLLR